MNSVYKINMNDQNQSIVVGNEDKHINEWDTLGYKGLEYNTFSFFRSDINMLVFNFYFWYVVT